MKLQISLSGYAGTESNLISLKNPVPNGDYHYFGLNPITHTPSARRLNDQLNSPSTIKRNKKKVKAKVNLEKEGDELQTVMVEPNPEMESEGMGEKPSNDPAKNVLPNGADMYYGLLPLEHNPVSQMVLSSGVNTVVKIKSKEVK